MKRKKNKYLIKKRKLGNSVVNSDVVQSFQNSINRIALRVKGLITFFEYHTTFSFVYRSSLSPCILMYTEISLMKKILAMKVNQLQSKSIIDCPEIYNLKNI